MLLTFGVIETSGTSDTDVVTEHDALSLLYCDHSGPPSEPLDATTVKTYSTPVREDETTAARVTRVAMTLLVPASLQRDDCMLAFASRRAYPENCTQCEDENTVFFRFYSPTPTGYR